MSEAVTGTYKKTSDVGSANVATTYDNRSFNSGERELPVVYNTSPAPIEPQTRTAARMVTETQVTGNPGRRRTRLVALVGLFAVITILGVALALLITIEKHEKEADVRGSTVALTLTPSKATETSTTQTLSVKPSSMTSTSITSTTPSTGPTTTSIDGCHESADVQFYVWVPLLNNTEEYVEALFTKIAVMLTKSTPSLCALTRIGVFTSSSHRRRRSLETSWYLVVALTFREGTEASPESVLAMFEGIAGVFNFPVATVLVKGSPPVCEFRCPDTLHCIAVTSLCDGHVDCQSSGIDESTVLCGQQTTPTIATTTAPTSSQCTDDQFECASDGACIRGDWRCDDYQDCDDNSDEDNCGCGAADFQCHNNLCIDMAKHCDGDVDCDDFSDEEGCPPKAVNCTEQEFECIKHAECINATLRCDGHYDCKDFSDEWFDCALSTPAPWTPTDYEVRLMTNDTDTTESLIGRVELRRRGSDDMFGTVCDDMWSEEDAMVICRMIDPSFSGIAYAYSFAIFGKGEGPILMTNLDCKGDEENIGQCMSRDIVLCTHAEDAGIQCGGVPLSRATRPTSYPTVRLVRGPDCLEGDVQFYHDGEWRFVCDHQFDDRAATVVCRMLGYRAAPGRAVLGSRPGDGKFWLDQVTCQGDETDLKDCSHAPLGEHSCESYEIALVVCAGDADRKCKKQTPHCTVNVSCDFDDDDCCYGFPTGSPYVRGSSTWAWYDAGQICVDDVTTGLATGGVVYYWNVYGNPGDYGSLVLPPLEGSSVARKLEFHHIIQPDGLAALSLEKQTSDGVNEVLWVSDRVSFYPEGTWGFTCIDLPADVTLVSEQLRFVARRGSASKVVALDGISLSDGTCNSSIVSAPCFFDKPYQCGMRILCEDCREGVSEYKWAWSSRDMESQRNTDIDDLPEYFVIADASHGQRGDVARLQFDLPFNEGREGLIFNYSIPDDKQTALKVVIHQGNSSYYTWNSKNEASTGSWQHACAYIYGSSGKTSIVFEAMHGGGFHGDIIINSVKLVSSCSDEPCDIQSGTCIAKFYSSDTEQYTWTKSNSDEKTIRLVDGKSQNEGRVEILHDGDWGTVCNDHWTMTEADVVCRQLGYSSASGYYKEAFFGEGEGYIWLTDVVCTGNEQRLSECDFDGWGTDVCDHTEDAGVACFPPDIEEPSSPGVVYTIQDGGANFGVKAMLVYPDLTLPEGPRKLTFEIKQTANDVLNVYLTDAREPQEPLHKTVHTYSAIFERVCINIPETEQRPTRLILESVKGRPISGAQDSELVAHSINITSGNCKDTLSDVPCTFEEDYRACSFSISTAHAHSCKGGYQWRRHTGVRDDHTHGDTTGHFMYVDTTAGEDPKESTIAFKQLEMDGGVPQMHVMLYYILEDTLDPTAELRLLINDASYALENRIPGSSRWTPMCVFLATNDSQTMDIAVTAVNVNAGIDDVIVSNGQCPEFSVNCDFQDDTVCGYILEAGWQSVDIGTEQYLRSPTTAAQLVSPRLELSGSQSCLTISTRTMNQVSKPAPRLNINVIALPTGESVHQQISGIPVYHTDWTNVSLNIQHLSGSYAVMLHADVDDDTTFIEISSVVLSDGECTIQECHDAYHACGSSFCLPDRYVCDNEDDCPDGSDEANCTTSVSCTFDKAFACGYQLMNSFVSMADDSTNGTVSHAVLQGDRDLAYIETPTMKLEEPSCLTFTFSGHDNNQHMFRVIQNKSSALTELANFGDVLSQDKQMFTRMALPTGSFSILFESQLVGDSNSAKDINIGEVDVQNGECDDACADGLFFCHAKGRSAMPYSVCLPPDVVCNGQLECPSGEDEDNCRTVESGPSTTSTPPTSISSTTPASVKHDLPEDFPDVSIISISKEVPRLDNIELTCVISGVADYKMTYYWYVNDQQVTRGSEIVHPKQLPAQTGHAVKYEVHVEVHVLPDTGSASDIYRLIVNRLDHEDTGTYTCMADVWGFNETQRPMDVIYLRVKDREPILEDDNCYTTSIEACHSIGQRKTILPGIFGINRYTHVSAIVDKAASQNTMEQDACKEPIQRLACGLYTPDCYNGTEVPVCREDCEEVTHACTSSEIMKYGCQFLPYIHDNPSCRRIWVGCGSMLTATAEGRYIRSKNYPESYTLNTNCDLYVVAEAERLHVVQYEILDLDLGINTTGSPCFLEFYDLGENTSLAVFPCGSIPINSIVTTSSRASVVKMVIESGSTGRGVLISYKQVLLYGCKSITVVNPILIQSKDMSNEDSACTSMLLYADNPRDVISVQIRDLQNGCVQVNEPQQDGDTALIATVCTAPYGVNVTGQVLLDFETSATYSFEVSKEQYVRRLDGVRLDGEGRVEVYSEGAVGSLCQSSISHATGEVICSSMGNMYFLHYQKSDDVVIPPLGNNFECTGDEKSISDCKIDFDVECSSEATTAITVECATPTLSCKHGIYTCGYDIYGDLLMAVNDGLHLEDKPGASGRAVSTKFRYMDGAHLHFTYTIRSSLDAFKLHLYNTDTNMSNQLWAWQNYPITGYFTGCLALPDVDDTSAEYQLVIELASSMVSLAIYSTDRYTGILESSISRDSCYDAVCTFENPHACEPFVYMCSGESSWRTSPQLMSDTSWTEQWIEYDHTIGEPEPSGSPPKPTRRGHFLVIDEQTSEEPLSFLNLTNVNPSSQSLRFFYSIMTTSYSENVAMTLFSQSSVVLQLFGNGPVWHGVCVTLQDDVGDEVLLAFKNQGSESDRDHLASLFLDDISLNSEPCPDSMSCSFEDMCAKQFQCPAECKSGFKWERLSLGLYASVIMFAPEHDVTLHTANEGHIMYARLEKVTEGDVAIMEIDVNQRFSSHACLNLYYYINSNSGDSGSLEVVFINAYQRHVTEIANGNQGDIWHASSTSVPSDVQKIQFIATKGFDESFIGIDDVSISSDNCVGGLQDVGFCSFDYPSLCAASDYSSSKSGSRWTRRVTSKRGLRILEYDADANDKTGYYMAVDGNFGDAGDVATLAIRVNTNSNQAYQFWYWVSDTPENTLSTYYSNGEPGYLNVDTQQAWLLSPCFQLPSVFTGFINIEAEKGEDARHFVAVDNLQLLDSALCQEPGLTCDFSQNGNCGFLSVPLTGQRWSRDADGWQTADSAVLNAPLYLIQSGQFCFKFTYSLQRFAVRSPLLSVVYNEETAWRIEGDNYSWELRRGQITLETGKAMMSFHSSGNGIYHLYNTTLTDGRCDTMQGCKESEFSCTDRCLPSYKVCDGALDCGGGEDEDITSCGFDYVTSFMTAPSLAETGYRKHDDSVLDWGLETATELVINRETTRLQTQMLVTRFMQFTNGKSVLQSPVHHLEDSESCLQVNYIANSGLLAVDVGHLDGKEGRRVNASVVPSASVRPFLVSVGSGYLQFRLIVGVSIPNLRSESSTLLSALDVTFGVTEILVHTGMPCTAVPIDCPDDIPLLCADHSGCYREDQLCDLVADCLDNSDESVGCGYGIECDFEHSHLCGYRNLTTPREYRDYRMYLYQPQSLWEQTASAIASRPLRDHTYNTILNGHFMSSRNYEGLLDKTRYVDEEIIQSPFQRFPADGCIQFWYYMNSTGHQPKSTTAQLLVYLQYEDSQLLELHWFDHVNRPIADWLLGGVPIQANRSASLVVKAKTSVPFDVYVSVVSLDDVSYVEGPCSVEKPVCDHTTFRCRNDKVCIPVGFVCDGEPDCLDGSDEESCADKPDGSLQLLGGDGTYGKLAYFYSHAWRPVCYPDAEFSQNMFNVREAHELCRLLGFSGNSDSFGHRFWEKHTEIFIDFSCENETCSVEPLLKDCGLYTYLRCSNEVCFSGEELCPGTRSTCRPRSQFCDGEMHCPGNGDENKCYCKSGETQCQHIEKECEEDACETCEDRNQFECSNHQCLDLALRCDGTSDCSDGTDEYRCVQVDKTLEVSMFDRASLSRLHICVDDIDVQTAQQLCHHAGKGYLLEILRGTDTIATGVIATSSNKGTTLDFQLQAKGDCFPLRLNCQQPECGMTAVQDSLVETLILNGEDAYIQEWPSFGQLLQDGISQCGVTLLSPGWAVSALHCVPDLAGNYSVWFGVDDRYNTGQWKQSIGIQDIKVFNDSVAFQNVPIYDIVLLKLERDALLNDYTRPACLPTQESVESAFSRGKETACYNVGFGATETILFDPDRTDILPRYLQKTRVDLVPKDMCQEAWEPFGGVEDHVVCVLREGPNAATCYGDSGGPLLCQNEAGRWEMFGALSYGLGACDSDTVPGVFTSVLHFKEWILSVTGIE